MELALLHFMLIIYCIAFADLEFKLRTSASIRNDRPLPDNDKKIVYFIKWLIIWEILVGIYCNSPWWQNVVDWEKIYIAKEPYRVESFEDRITDLDNEGDGERGSDEKGDYKRLHYIERYRVSRNNDKWIDTLDTILNENAREMGDKYDIEVTRDGVVIYRNGLITAKAEWKCGDVFGYVYIEWDYRFYYEKP